MNQIVAPVAKSVFLCDAVAADKESGKFTVNGLFNSLIKEFIPGMPSVVDDFCVFAELIGGIVQASVRVEIIEALNGEVIFRTFRGRHSVVGVCFRINQLAISSPGFLHCPILLQR